MHQFRPIFAGMLLALIANRAAAQTTFDACYVPSVGAIYLIKQAGLPSACLAQAHAQFTWTSGGVIADGSVQTAMLADGAVTPAKLSFNPATQTELNALAAAGTINTATNPVDWTQLKNVPAGFADGTDGGGGVSDHGGLTGLTDDDHVQYLLADGVRNTTNGFAVTGALGAGTIPATGGGVRLMWYPHKAAFRAGATLGTGWDDASIGNYSIAMGYATTASGVSSTASGFLTTASDFYATALGNGSQATAASATAMGSVTLASGISSTAMGQGTNASGDYSTALGLVSTAAAFGSVAIGTFNITGGSPSAWIATDALFMAGNGTSSAPSNALTLLKNGNMTIAGTLTQSSDIRFKEGIRPMDRALDGVLDLRPIYYRFREGTGHPTDEQIGLAAQEVEQIFPQLVHRDSEGKLSVAYTQLAAVLVRAMQEQQELIVTLNKRIEQLESARRVAASEAR